MKLSIIIVNYKSKDLLERCVSAVFKNVKGVSFEVIVVNNDEKNPSLALPFTKGEDIKIINSGENLGFGKACNKGAKKAQGRVLLFLNPDTEIVSENIQLILKEFNSQAKQGIIGPKLLTGGSKTQEWSAGVEVTLFDIIKNNLGFFASKKIWESKRKISCAWVSGAALFIRQDLFQKLGGFDEKFFMYFEDIDLCRRARQAGSQVIYYPDFKVRHLGGKSFIEKSVQKKYYYASQDHYFQKHFSKTIALFVRILRKLFS